MNFGAIIERSLKLVRNHTLLWKLGLLAIFTEGVTSFIFSGPPSPMPSDSKTDQELAELTTKVSDWVAANVTLAVAGGILVVLLILAAWYVSLRAKAGLILAVDGLEQNRTAPRFPEAFRSGKVAVWRLVGLYVVFGFMVMAVLAVPFGIVAAIAEQMGEEALFALFLLALPFIFVIAAYVSFITKIAERSIVLDNQRIWAALGTAHRWLFRRLGNSLVALMIDIAFQILFVMLIVAVIIIAIGLAALVGLLLATILPSSIMVAVIGAVAILLTVGFLLLGGWFTAFTISYWTLIYRAFNFLTKKGD